MTTVDKLPYVNCKACKYFQIWTAGGCNRSNGEPLCMHRAFAYGAGGGYGFSLPAKRVNDEWIYDGKTPDWCPLNKGVGYYRQKKERIKQDNYWQIREAEKINECLAELDKKIEELEKNEQAQQE